METNLTVQSECVSGSDSCITFVEVTRTRYFLFRRINKGIHTHKIIHLQPTKSHIYIPHIRKITHTRKIEHSIYNPQNHTSTFHTPAKSHNIYNPHTHKSHIYIPHTRKITHLQNHKIISTTYTPTKSHIYNQHTHKITHLQPTYPPNHTSTTHTKSHIYKPQNYILNLHTHKITQYLQPSHPQNNTSRIHTPTKPHNIYNAQNYIYKLHANEITQRLQPTHPQNHTTSTIHKNDQQPTYQQNHTTSTTHTPTKPHNLLTTKRLRTPVTGWSKICWLFKFFVILSVPRGFEPHRTVQNQQQTLRLGCQLCVRFGAVQVKSNWRI